MPFSINDVPYQIVDQSKVRTGTRSYVETIRPSQGFESSIVTRSWDLWGPMGFSRAGWDSKLAIDYTVNLDHSNKWLLLPTATRTTIALQSHNTVQYILPTSDVQQTNWAEVTGDGDGDTFDELDEGGPLSGAADDATTSWSTTTQSAELIEGMASPTNTVPQYIPVGSNLQVGVRFKLDTSPTVVRIRLYQGTTIVFNDATSYTGTDWQTATLTLSQSEADLISDFTALRVGVNKNSSGGGEVDVTAVEVSVPDPDGGNVITIDEDRGQLFFQHGSFSEQVGPNDMASVEEVDHGAFVTDSVPEWHGTGFVALGDQDTVQERTTVGFVSSTYTGITAVEAFKLVVATDRMWMVDAGVTNSAHKNKLKFIKDVLASRANISNPFQITDPGSVLTGLFAHGENTFLGFARGVNSFTSSGKPVELLTAIKNFKSSNNGRSGSPAWGWDYVATELGLYALSVDGKVANPVGPAEGQRGKGFEGAIDGFPTAVEWVKEDLIVAYLTTGGDTYILRGEFGAETGATGLPDWYAFRKLSSVECNAIGFTNTRTNPTLMFGENAQASWYTLGRRGRDIADSNYSFSTDAGTAFLTTLMLPEGAQANLRYAKFQTENTDANHTWTLAVDVDDAGSYINVGSAVVTNGMQTLRPVSGSPSVPLPTVSFNSIKPRLSETSNTTTNPPQIRGPLTMAFDLRPDMVQEIDVVVEWNSASDWANLQTLVSDDTLIPVTLHLPTDAEVNTPRYAYIQRATVQDRTSPTDKVIQLKLVVWDLS